MTFKIAVSYSHHDVACVVTDVEALANSKISFWMDRSLTGGVMWREEIAQHFAESDAVMAFLSPSWIGSDYCRQEISFALDQGKPVLCVYLEETKLTPGLQMSLNHRQTIYRFQHAQNLAEFYTRVNDALNAIGDEQAASASRYPETQLTTRLSPQTLQLVYDNKQYSVENQANNRFTIGRSSECDLVVRSDFVSRVHGYLYFQKGKYYYQDTSSNGTELLSSNQEIHLQQDPHQLQNTGQLIIGGSIINFHVRL